MTTKQYLQQVYWAKRNIARLEKEIKELEDEIESISATDYSKDRVDVSEMSNTVEDSVIRLVKCREKLISKQNDYTKIREKIGEEIESLDDELYKEVLSLRYIHCMNWQDILIVMNYSEHIYRLHGEALLYFEQHVSKC